ncbi:MAG: hypothetical protein J7M25_04730 [Deltaproteobacteria bacterium]|nr:hypothetical protein [Deltaproteobacteria bacterium]
MAQQDATQEMQRSESDTEIVEAWQVLQVERITGEDESTLWGEGGQSVLAWFDLGDLQAVLYQAPGADLPVVEKQAGLGERMLAWFSALVGNEPRYRLVGCHGF